MNNTNNNTNNTERRTYQNRPAQSANAPRPIQAGTPRPTRSASTNGQVQNTQRTSAGAQNPVRRPEGYSQQPRPVRPSASSSSTSKLTVEERRRIEAARLAAMNSVKRMSDDEEYRLRRMEQEYLAAEQPKIQRSSQDRAGAQPREDERASAAATRDGRL